MSTARLATRQDLPALGEALAAAFATDPVWEWVVPEPDRWKRAPAAFEVEVRTKQALGHAWTTDDAAGAALWAPPGRWRGSLGELLRSAAAMGRFVGLAGAKRGLRLVHEAERRHPREEHWYLAVLATHPDHQGRGVGSTVLRPVLERCDLDGTAAYLESSNPDNRGFYERHGFAVTDTIRVGEGPPIDLMWREPAAPGERT